MRPPIPTGRIEKGSDGLDLVATRTLPGSVRDAWASITEPERTARWFGRWEGTGAPGETVKVQMGFEESSPWVEARILECDAPRLLRLRTLSDEGSWDLSLELTESTGGDQCELRFVHHNIVPTEVGNVGPGWEYYLDQLVAVSTAAPMPDWDEYFPAQQEYFDTQVAGVERS